MCSECEGDLTIECCYRADIFDEDTVARWLQCLRHALAVICAHPDKKLADIPIISESERHQILREWNNTRRDFPQDQTLAEMVQAQALRTPEAVALINGEEHVRYAQLNHRANQLAHYLVQMGLKPESVAAVCLEPSAEWAIAALAVAKAGAAILPIRANLAVEQLQWMLQDSGASLLLTRAETAAELPAHPAKILVPEDEAQWSHCSEADPHCPAHIHSLACVSYAPGPNGELNAVAVEHRSLTRRLYWLGEFFERDELSGVLAATRLDQQASLFELFAPLCFGGAAIFAPESREIPSLPGRLHARTMNAAAADVLSLLEAKVIPESVRTINVFGEFVAANIVAALYDLPHVRKVNTFYGPPEASLFAAGLQPARDTRPSLGRPLPNSQVYILDPSLQVQPIGVPGEIFLGGAGVARGYWNRDPLTPENFIANPFNSRPGAKLFRTGQMGRYLADGTIEYLGRKGSPEYISPGSLAETPAPVAGDSAPPASGAAALTPTEEQLLEIWKEVIGVKELTVTDNFFDLGGHSVLVIQMLTRIRRSFGVSLTLRAFFDAPTVALLAAIVDARLAEQAAGLAEEGRTPGRQLVTTP
jgi:non-ribosomal peptide synthetase component F/aryl carrier-like protein